MTELLLCTVEAEAVINNDIGAESTLGGDLFFNSINKTT
jgi:hypothetical protein